MTRTPTTRDMSDAHEIFLADLFEGRRAIGSGNQPKDQMDGRNRRYDQAHALAWDGKSTRSGTVSIGREMWRKAREQSHGEIPMLALRFYNAVVNRLAPELDLVVLDANDFVEILADARKWREHEEFIETLRKDKKKLELIMEKDTDEDEL